MANTHQTTFIARLFVSMMIAAAAMPSIAQDAILQDSESFSELLAQEIRRMTSSSDDGQSGPQGVIKPVDDGEPANESELPQPESKPKDDSLSNELSKWVEDKKKEQANESEAEMSDDQQPPTESEPAIKGTIGEDAADRDAANNDPVNGDGETPNPRRLIHLDRSARELAKERFSDRALGTADLSPLDFSNRAVDSATPSRLVSIKSYHWVNPAPSSQPTYFDDVDLERYGHEVHCQTVRSGLRFAADLLLLPCEAIDKPCNCLIYQSGLERPGDAACPVTEKRH
ncbi:MAG: hypothetical protein WBD20_10600 [Pirellulaceae bacterium]